MANQVFDQFPYLLMKGELDLNAPNQLSVLLVRQFNATIITSAVTVADTLTTTFSGDITKPLTEISGVSYTYGGYNISATSAINDNGTVYLDAGDINWYSASFVCGGAVIFKSAVNYLASTPLYYLDFSVNRVVENGLFSLKWDSQGLLQIAQGT